LGLRAHQQVDNAAEYIMKRREQHHQRIEEERRRSREQAEKRKFGKTVSGLWLDVQLVTALCDMGFQKKLVIEALRQTDNNQEMGLQLLTQESHLLQVKDKKRKDPDFTNEIQQIEMMGFSATLALGTLLQTGTLESAIELLLSGKGIEAFPEQVISTNNNINANDNKIQVAFDQSIPMDAPTELLDIQKQDERLKQEQERLRQEEEERLKKEEEGLLKKEAEDELLQSVQNDDEDAHLDVSLEEEENILNEFKMMIESQIR